MLRMRFTRGKRVCLSRSTRLDASRLEGPEHMQSPKDAIDQARKMLRVQRNLTRVSDSLFDTIEINEVGPATVLAYRMINNHASSFEAVRVAFERARADFAMYDGVESPRTWALSYVAEEAVKRSTMQSSSPGSTGPQRPGAEAILQRLEPERRLAVILIDVLGLTDEAAARVARTDTQALLQQVASARSELGDLWPTAHAGGSASGEAA